MSLRLIFVTVEVIFIDFKLSSVLTLHVLFVMRHLQSGIVFLRLLFLI